MNKAKSFRVPRREQVPPLKFKTLLKFKRHLQTLGYSESLVYNVSAVYVVAFLKYLGDMGIYEIEQVTSNDIQRYHEYLQSRPNKRRSGSLSESSIVSHMYGIRLYLGWQEQLGKISQNPISPLSFKAPVSEPRQILSIEEIQILYAVCADARERAILSLFYGCGLRRSEGAQLNTRDINFRERLLYVRAGKGKKRRVIPMSKQVSRDLKNYYQMHRGRYLIRNYGKSTEAFMLNTWGTRMRGESCYFLFKDILKRVIAKGHLPVHYESISLHHLRHSIASHLLASGLSVEQVRDFLGHSYLETTQLYTRVSQEQLQAVLQ